MTTQHEDYINAAKLDILDLLGREKPRVFEFRRVSEIGKLMCDLINGFGQPVEHSEIILATRLSEDRAPHLHDVLIGRQFNGNDLLRAKYDEMSQKHRELKIAAIGIQDAAAKVEQAQADIDHHKKALRMHEEALERERERLQLVAATAGVQINLPTLPELPASLLDGNEDEAYEEDAAG